MATMRKLKLQFGLVTADVDMELATSERSSVEFKRLHGNILVDEVDDKGQPVIDTATGKPKQVLKPCMGETGNKSYCKVCLTETSDFIKGLEVSKKNYVEISEAELEGLKVPTNGAVVIHEVADESYLLNQPMFFSGKSYYLQPPKNEKYPATTFALIHEGLKGHVAIGRTALYGKEDTVAVLPSANGFIMHILRYPRQIRTENQVTLPGVDQKQLGLMTMIVDSMKVPVPRLDYPDDWADGVQKLKNDKIAGVATMPVTPAGPVIPPSTLEDDLRRTLEAIKASKAKAAPVAEEPVKAEPKGKKKKGKAA